MSQSSRVPFNDISRVYDRYHQVIESSMLAAMRSAWWLNGKRSDSFALNFANFVGAKYCIPVANGTDALEIAVKAAASKLPGKSEVITVANAGGYTTTAVRAAGFVPVYADILEDSQLLDLESALTCLSEKTLAIVVTHLYGGVVDVAALRNRLADGGYAKIAIIEDCAQAHGAKSNGQRVGSLGDITAFSFYPTKNLGAAGDAGAVLTSCVALADAARQLHQYGWSAKYRISRAGGRNSRIDELQAGMLDVMLPHLADLNSERANVMERIEKACPGHVRPLVRAAGSVVHLAVVRSAQRDALRNFLDKQGIATDIHYPILDCDQEGWQDLPFRVAPDGLAVSQRSVGQLLSLPCFIGMTTEEVDHICTTIAGFSGV